MANDRAAVIPSIFIYLFSWGFIKGKRKPRGKNIKTGPDRVLKPVDRKIPAGSLKASAVKAKDLKGVSSKPLIKFFENSLVKIEVFKSMYT